MNLAFNYLQPREDIKVFFGNTIEDDYKSQLYLEQYLKHKILNDDNKLNDQTKTIVDNIFKDKQESNDYKEYENIANNEPYESMENTRRQWL